MMFKRKSTLQKMKQSKPPKLGGGLGTAAPANIAKALGVSPGLPVHPQMLMKLFNHPDMGVSRTAKALYGNMSQKKVKQSKQPY